MPSKERFQQNKSALAEGLAPLLGKSKAACLSMLEKQNEQEIATLIARNLTYSEYPSNQTASSFSLPSLRGGLIVESKMMREHPIGKIAERTIGYEKPDPAGNFLRVGLEGAFRSIFKRRKRPTVKTENCQRCGNPSTTTTRKNPPKVMTCIPPLTSIFKMSLTMRFYANWKISKLNTEPWWLWKPRQERLKLSQI